MSEGPKIKALDVLPEMSMYNLLESYPYDLSSAISEYVDNSLQAYLDAGSNVPQNKLTITITIDYSNKHDKKIIVKDDGVGIPEEDLQRAMKPAFKATKQNLNEFGIGMKAASVWLGRMWKLDNALFGSEYINSIEFDLDNLILNNLNSVNVKHDFNTKNLHGVTITINKLNKEFSTEIFKRTYQNLEETYQIFIYKKKILEIIMKLPTEETLIMSSGKDYETPKILNYPTVAIFQKKLYKKGLSREWKQNVDFEFNGHKVHGFVMCRKESSQTQNPGLKLFRQERLIIGTSKVGYRPIELVGTANKHAPSRFYGELHLDHQKISNTKGYFDIDKTEFIRLLKMQPGVGEILDQAKNYRAREANTMEEYPADCIMINEERKESIEDVIPEISNSIKSSDVKVKESKNSEKNINIRTPLNILDIIKTKTNSLLLQSIIPEAKTLYSNDFMWGFVFCYRMILEKVIHMKLERDYSSLYIKNKLEDKSIVALFLWINSNQHEFNFRGKWSSLKGVMTHLQKTRLLEIPNVAAHGHYKPLRDDIESLLVNTQLLVEWAMDEE